MSGPAEVAPRPDGVLVLTVKTPAPLVWRDRRRPGDLSAGEPATLLEAKG